MPDKDVQTADTRISDSEFSQFGDFFYRVTGIRFGKAKRYFVDRRLLERITESQAGSFRQYLALISEPEGTEERQRLINALTVNETSFMRERYQFRCLTVSLLPELMARQRRGEPLRIWCIPSSSGEEPYSIAMHLQETLSEPTLRGIHITASDISTRILERASRGLYSTHSVRNLPPEWTDRYFTHTPLGYQIAPALQRQGAFTRVNLSDPADMRQAGTFDVIFCRNLLIYFDETSRREAAERLFHALNPGGFLCLGHSESMEQMSSRFLTRKFPDALVYQKPL